MSGTPTPDSLQNSGDHSNLFLGWLAAIGIGMIVGLYGVVRLLTEGTVVLGIDSQLPWGVLISTYVFFVLLSTGICIGVTALATVFGIERYEPLVKRGVFLSMITLVSGGVVIMSGLGQPLRTLPAMLLSPNPASPMWWMIVMYSFYGLALAVEFYLAERREDVRSWLEKGVGLAALVAPVFAGATLGAIFGIAEARPYYSGIYAPVYMLVTAVMGGVALVTAVGLTENKFAAGSGTSAIPDELVEPLGTYLGVLVAVVVFLIGLRHMYGLTATDGAMFAAHTEMLFGTHSLWYVTVGLGLGLLAPLAILVVRRQTQDGVLVASILVLVGLFASRLEYVLGGQVIALVADPAYEYPTVSYAPTLTEYTVVVLGFAVFALLYTGGRRWFNLDGFPHTTDRTSLTPETGSETTGDDDD